MFFLDVCRRPSLCSGMVARHEAVGVQLCRSCLSDVLPSFRFAFRFHLVERAGRDVDPASCNTVTWLGRWELCV